MIRALVIPARIPGLRARRGGLAACLGLRRERRALADLEPWLLSDVALTQAEADVESRRPVWDVPSHWRTR